MKKFTITSSIEVCLPGLLAVRLETLTCVGLVWLLKRCVCSLCQVFGDYERMLFEVYGEKLVLAPHILSERALREYESEGKLQMNLYTHISDRLAEFAFLLVVSLVMSC